MSEELLCPGGMSEEVSGSSEFIIPSIDGEYGSSPEKMGEGELLDLIVAAKKEVLRSQGLARESVQLMGMSRDLNQTHPSKAISLMILAVFSLGMVYAMLPVFKTPYNGPPPS